MPKFIVKFGLDCLSYKGFHLEVVEGNGTINRSTYCDIIREFVPYSNALFENGWILVQDGATPHTAKDTKQFFMENNLQVLQRPANFPDVTSIKNTWNILKQHVEKACSRTKAELREKDLGISIQFFGRY